mmetsp:Transcript_8002/g.24163  ORF Transcript_8002/g.24163 Transcript_8002/m.24163 type:complete len:252 (+) Transcript_8002:86-841(+)
MLSAIFGLSLGLLLPGHGGGNGLVARETRLARDTRLAIVSRPPPEGFTWADEDIAAPAAPAASAAAPAGSAGPVSPERVNVLQDASAVAASVAARVESAAEAAIAERGHFALAIPGGSVLKMLQSSPSFADRTTLAPTSISSWSTTSCTRRTRSRFTGTAEGGWRVAAGGEPAALFPLGGAALTARGVRRGRRRRGLSRRPCPWAGRRGGPGAHALRTPLRARRGAQQRCACRCYSRRLWPVCVDLHLDGF